NTSGASYNLALGYQAGKSVTSGFGNIILGANPDTVTGITTGGNNIGLGYDIRFPSVTGNNQFNLGNILFGTLPATSSAASFTLPTTGAIGVGTSSPYAEFAIHANNGSTNATLFAIGSTTSASATTTLFSVSNTGSILTSLGTGLVKST